MDDFRGATGGGGRRGRRPPPVPPVSATGSVFSERLKTVRVDRLDVMTLGRLFHNVGAAWRSARSANFSLQQSSRNRFLLLDRS